MPQSQVQIEQQVERQLQKLTPQQLMVAKLVELPVVELEERVKTEVYDNVALEEGHDDNDNSEDLNEEEHFGDEPNGSSQESNLDGQYDDDEMPVYTPSSGRSADEEIPIGDTKSFIEDLKRQMYDFDLTDRQQELVEYLIGTLDDRGFIDRSLQGISDDLLFNFNIDAGVNELEDVLHILQKFEPAGIGARDLKECLLLQIDRKLSEQNGNESKAILNLERVIVEKYLEMVQRKQVDQLASLLNVSKQDIQCALEGISKLNPHPGLALSESSEDRAQTIIPDFIIDTSPEGDISIELNNGEIPQLRVSPEYEMQLKAYQKVGNKMTKSQQQAFEYTKQKVEGAKMFIDSIRQRQRTLFVTMKAIVDFQRNFILTQDESTLKPMRLIDIAEQTKLDLSTISRVRKSKYALIDGNLYPLDFFFLRVRTNAEGETLEHKEIKQKIQELIDAEDKDQPLSDQKIAEMLNKQKLNISRRTVAKYRSEMGIPATTERRNI